MNVSAHSSKADLMRTFSILFVLAFIVASLMFYYSRDGGALSTAVSANTVFPEWNLSMDKAIELARKKVAKAWDHGVYDTRNLSFERIHADPSAAFDIEAGDVIVFLHIQKTAGTTFERFLTRHLDIERPCWCRRGRKRCECYRTDETAANGSASLWLFSRYSTGWSCGLHADWTELVVSNCVDNVLDKKEHSRRKRRYFYTSFLREPVARFVSEWRHVQRGATWAQSRHVCDGRPPTPAELPACFDADDGWPDVPLADFLACPFNLARDRQTRMLADLTLVRCYDRTAMTAERRAQLMLASAKRNLRSMAFFGLQEDMAGSQLVFERSFGMRFSEPLADGRRRSKSSLSGLTDEQLAAVRSANHLDVELYEYARRLFNERYEMLTAQPNATSPTDLSDAGPPTLSNLSV